MGRSAALSPFAGPATPGRSGQRRGHAMPGEPAPRLHLALSTPHPANPPRPIRYDAQMNCPACGGEARVLDSRPVEDAIRRRRACTRCDHRFTTFERIAELDPMVVKRDGRREPFQAEKVLASLRLACVKRPVPQGSLERIVENVRARAIRRAASEISSVEVGEWVLERLVRLDRIAALRFASVFRQPADLDALRTELAAIELAPTTAVADEPGTEQPALPGMDGGGSRSGSRRRVSRRPPSGRTASAGTARAGTTPASPAPDGATAGEATPGEATASEAAPLAPRGAAR